MIRRLNENKESQIYVARLDDGEVFYEGKLNSTFKDILGRTIDMYYTVENVVVSYLRGRGYEDVDDWSSDELADIFVDEFIEDGAKDFNRYKDFTLMRDNASESMARYKSKNKLHSVESMRRNRRRGLREGNASLKTNYAVIVYDMNTGSYNLYTGTKKMCEQLYKDLFDFNIDDYDDDEKEDMYDWLYGRLNEFNCIERIDFRRGIDYRDNYSDGYDKYHIINYTKPRHPISLYLWYKKYHTFNTKKNKELLYTK